MLDETLDFEGVDEICCEIEHLSALDPTLLDLNVTVSAPID